MVRFLGIAEEATFGTPVTPPTTFLDCLSIGLHSEREAIDVESSAFIGGLSGMAGALKILGDIEIVPSSENIALLLKFMFGDPTTTEEDSNGRYLHEYLPDDDLVFGTFYKCDEAWPDASNALQYISVIPIEVRLEAALNAAVSMVFSCFGQKEAKVSLPNLGTIPSIQQFFSLQGKLYWDSDFSQGTEETWIDSISLSYKRSIPDDFFTMNDVFLKGLIPGFATLEGTLDLIFKDWTAMEKYWGNTDGPQAQPAYTTLDLDFHGPSLGGAGEYQYHSMRWQMPSVRILSTDEPFERRDKVIQTLNFKCYNGTIGSDTAMVKVTLANTMSDV